MLIQEWRAKTGPFFSENCPVWKDKTDQTESFGVLTKPLYTYIGKCEVGVGRKSISNNEKNITV